MGEPEATIKPCEISSRAGVAFKLCPMLVDLFKIVYVVNLAWIIAQSGRF